VEIREVVPFLERFTGEGAIYEGEKVSVGLFNVKGTGDGVLITSSLFPGVLPHVLTLSVGDESVWVLRFYSPDGRAVPYKPLLREMGEERLRDLFGPLLESGHIFRFRNEGIVQDIDDLISRIKYPALHPERYAYLDLTPEVIPVWVESGRSLTRKLENSSVRGRSGGRTTGYSFIRKST